MVQSATDQRLYRSELSTEYLRHAVSTCFAEDARKVYHHHLTGASRGGPDVPRPATRSMAPFHHGSTMARARSITPPAAAAAPAPGRRGRPPGAGTGTTAASCAPAARG